MIDSDKLEQNQDGKVAPTFRHYALVVVASTLVLLVLAAHGFGLTRWLDLQAVLSERQALRAWVSEHHTLSAVAFMAAYVAIAALAIPGAVVLTLLGGFLFGRWLGTVLAIIGATMGALIVFLIARGAFGALLRRRAQPLFDGLARRMKGNAIEILVFLRLVPLFPFFLVNIVAALFDVTAGTFVMTTAFGIAPATFIYSSVGQDFGAVSSLRGLLSPAALASLLGLAALSLLPVIAKRFKPGLKPARAATSDDAS